MRSKYKCIFMQPGDSDGQKSELDASSEHDVHSVGDDKATYIGDMKIHTRVLDLEKKNTAVFLDGGDK